MTRQFFLFRYNDLIMRIKELEGWTSDFSLPCSVWLSGFFNPQSFLTAIMQSTARKNELPLDRMSLACDVTKKTKEEMQSPPREGAHIHGLYMEGARWDITAGSIVESRLKELHPLMPVMYIKALTQDKQASHIKHNKSLFKISKREEKLFIWDFFPFFSFFLP